ncbi:hypothetical protein LINGRAHAP2_LOCUS17672 [Linum grandiflorum]
MRKRKKKKKEEADFVNERVYGKEHGEHLREREAGGKRPGVLQISSDVEKAAKTSISSCVPGEHNRWDRHDVVRLLEAVNTVGLLNRSEIARAMKSTRSEGQLKSKWQYLVKIAGKPSKPSKPKFHRKCELSLGDLEANQAALDAAKMIADQKKADFDWNMDTSLKRLISPLFCYF